MDGFLLEGIWIACWHSELMVLLRILLRLLCLCCCSVTLLRYVVRLHQLLQHAPLLMAVSLSGSDQVSAPANMYLSKLLCCCCCIHLLLLCNVGQQTRVDLVNGRLCSRHWSHDSRHLWHEFEIDAGGQYHWFLGHDCCHSPGLLLDLCCFVQVHMPAPYSLNHRLI